VEETRGEFPAYDLEESSLPGGDLTVKKLADERSRKGELAPKETSETTQHKRAEKR